MHMPGLLHLLYYLLPSLPSLPSQPPLAALPPRVSPSTLKLHPASRMGVRGPEQGNLYSKRRYEPVLYRSPRITLAEYEIRRHVTGVLNFARARSRTHFLNETCGISNHAYPEPFIDVLRRVRRNRGAFSPLSIAPEAAEGRERRGEGGKICKMWRRY